jgi:hypothetical protein
MLGLRWQLYSGLVGLSLLAASTEYRPPRNSSQQPVPSHSHFVPFCLPARPDVLGMPSPFWRRAVLDHAPRVGIGGV